MQRFFHCKQVRQCSILEKTEANFWSMSLTSMKLL